MFIVFLFLSFALKLDNSGLFPFSVPFSDTGDSPISLKYLNDGPAGIHGFLRVGPTGETFFEKETTKVRFFGVQLFFNDPPHEIAEVIAKRLRKMGMNIWKWGGLELFWNNGIGTEDWERRIERFDYLFYQMKKHGIYCYAQMDEYGLILPSKKYREAEEFYRIRNVDSFPEDHRTMTKAIQYIMEPSYFDALKKYWKSFFYHRNPYTNLLYKDDPAIVAVEISNENFLLKQWEYFGLKCNKWPDLFRKRLKNLWNTWLSNKYSSIDEIKYAWREFGKKGLLPDERYGDIALLPLKITDRRFSQGRKEDVAHFLYDLQSAYIDSVKNFLRGIGVKALIVVGNDFQMSLPSLSLASKGDFIDTHIYFNHPTSLGSKGMIKNTNPFKMNMTLITAVAANSVEGKGVCISEANWSYPSRHQYLFLPMLSAYASFQDWNIIILHAFCSRRTYKLNYIEQQLVTGLNPMLTLQSYIAALVFRKGFVSSDSIVHTIHYNDMWKNYFEMYSQWFPDKDGKNILNNFLPHIFKVRKSFGGEITDVDISFSPYDNETFFENTTGELTFDKGEERFIIDTRYVKSVNGYLKGEIHLKNFVVEVTTPDYGSVSLISMDEKPILNSRKLLVISVTQTLNAGATWAIPGKSFLKWGHGPTMLGVVNCRIRIGLKDGDVFVFPLDSLGRKIRDRMFVHHSGEGVEFEIDKGQRTAWYLLEVK